MEAIDELIYGDNSIHDIIRKSFGDECWSRPSQLYNFKFMLRRIRPN